MNGDIFTDLVITKGASTTIDPIILPINNRQISIRYPEPEALNLKYYVDLLYYNKVNVAGDIMTSLVKIGDYRNSTINSTFVYSPNKLFNSSLAESQISISSSSNVPAFNYVNTQNSRSLYNDIKSKQELDRNSRLSVISDAKTIRFDGWYTLMTVAVTDSMTSIEGSLRWKIDNLYLPYQVINSADTLISDISNTTLKMGQLPYLTSIYNSYKKQDFFVCYESKLLLLDLLQKSNSISKLPKHSEVVSDSISTMYYYLNKGDFKESQKILQTIIV